MTYTFPMCGIAGVYNTERVTPDLDVLRAMADTISHRGPEGEGYFTEAGVGLAHRHLRIIDLSDAAQQPMSNECGSLHLILNGEIYNYVELRPVLEQAGHRFSTHSDTEVLLHAYQEWGVECLSRFNGMFAFAIWDSEQQTLFLARDRIGVKPLYYAWDGSTLVFGSEIKALLEHESVSAEPHFPAICEYMSAMYTTGDHTWFRGIKRLLPGHYITANQGGITVRQWWDMPAQEDAPGANTERGYAQQVRGLLEDSVKLRLRSDAPLGAHLSGGLDSSSVVALLARWLKPEGEQVRTFSGAFAEGREYDERHYIADVVRRYNTRHHETVPTAGDLPALLERMVWHMDEPAAGPGILLQWAVCRETREAGVTVINGGQGGDEAWGGYFGYVPAYLKTLLAQSRRQPSLLLDLAWSAIKLLRQPHTRAAMLRAFARGRTARLQPSGTVGAWAGPVFREASAANQASEPTPSSRAKQSPLAAAMYYDLKWYLPALLQVEDRMSMAFSLESRAPLLDYRLIELSARVPSSLKMKGLDMKHILKLAVKDLVPATVYNRRDKMGMPTPLAIWFRGSLAIWVREQLDSDEVRGFGILSQEYVGAMLMEHTTGKADRSLELWKMLNLVTWWRIFVQGNSPYSSHTPEKQGALATRP